MPAHKEGMIQTAGAGFKEGLEGLSVGKELSRRPDDDVWVHRKALQNKAETVARTKTVKCRQCAMRPPYVR
ncbi:uncharacterized protein SPSK_02108 [Sporothrix schenckii 1099-18]|uniref:Uncharacterized protein n=1 Tax=Sporothrix schenckii 1099-18 TaxID=1397361 RepID=A0A0F2MC35_SPOSC|nr:uncharacterized protein SPSK_02108 [Sporothrix schenckii 1099-18]KJR87202.1 hypothetical protein SPSK_02108 [Sporothrix schenckii 1099-18]